MLLVICTSVLHKFYGIQMLFRLFTEIGLIVIGLMYASNQWFDSIMNLLKRNNGNNENRMAVV